MKMKQTILILDDDPAALDEICETLSDEGYNTIAVGTVSELNNKIDNQEIDLFILDLMLPDGSGLSVTTEIRQRSDVGIIMVTGKSGETDRVVGLEVGADDYITKPFSPRELLARVRALLRRTKGTTYSDEDNSKGGQNDMVEFGGWKLDMAARHLLSPDGADISLTTAEFDLLQVFVESPNRVHARDYLLDAVHGREWAGYDRGIDGLVSRLRKKLKPVVGAPDYIKTVRGAGYLFTPKIEWKSSRPF